jgi:hypothetical protein
MFASVLRIQSEMTIAALKYLFDNGLVLYRVDEAQGPREGSALRDNQVNVSSVS